MSNKPESPESAEAKEVVNSEVPETVASGHQSAEPNDPVVAESADAVEEAKTVEQTAAEPETKSEPESDAAAEPETAETQPPESESEAEIEAEEPTQVEDVEVRPPIDMRAGDTEIVELDLDDDDTSTLHSDPTLVFKDDDPPKTGDIVPWMIHGVETKTVGRDVELEQLRTAFKRTIDDNRVQLVNVVGELGIGKSRLLTEFNRTLDNYFEHANSLYCSESSTDPTPFAIFHKLLRYRFYILGSEKGETACQKFLDGVKYILDADNAEEIAHLVGHLVGFKFAQSPYVNVVSDDVHRLREKASQALVTLLRADARRSPLILAFDNLEHADHESLALLDYLIQHLEQTPILLITAGDPEFLDRQPSWARKETIHLRPLDPAGTRELLGDILQLADEIPEELHEVILKKSGGHPLAVEGIIRYLVDLDMIVPGQPKWTIETGRLDSIDIPLTLKGVVSARLENQTPKEIALLEKAAVIGNTFWFGALLMLYRMDSDSWPEAEKNWAAPHSDHTNSIQALLDGLIQKDILDKKDDTQFPGETEYVFKYAIERESVLERGEPRAHDAKHRMIAHWLTIHAGDYIEEYFEQIARHWEHGGRPETAAHYFLKMADSAKNRYANKKAIRFYEKTIHLIAMDDYTRKLEIYHDLGNVLSLIGEYESALGYFQEMLRLAWILGSRSKGGVAYNKMGRTYRELGEYEYAMENFQKSMTLFDAVNDTRGIASNSDDMGRIYWLQGDVEKALGFHRKSAKLRREIGDKRSIALSLNNIGNIYLDRGDIKHAVRCFKEALELRREIGDQQGLTRSLNNLAVIFCERGKIPQSIELWKEALRIAEEIGDREVQGILHANLGEALITAENWKEAERHLKKAITIGEDIGDRRPMADAFINLGRLSMLDGDIQQAVELTRSAMAIAEYLGSKRLMGIAFKALGDIHANSIYDDETPDQSRDADAFYTRSVDILREISCESELGKSMMSYGNYLIERSQMDKGKELLQQAREIFDRLEMKPILEKARGIIAEL